MSDIEKVERALAQAIDSGDKALANEYADLLEALGRQQIGRKNTKDYGALNALRHGLQQGATFGFADEISAAARAGLDKLFGGEKYGGDFGDLYRMYRDDERAQIEGGREHHGKKMFAAEFVPGLLQGGAGIGRATGKATAREALEAGTHIAGSQFGKCVQSISGLHHLLDIPIGKIKRAGATFHPEGILHRVGSLDIVRIIGVTERTHDYVGIVAADFLLG